MELTGNDHTRPATGSNTHGWQQEGAALVVTNLAH